MILAANFHYCGRLAAILSLPILLLACAPSPEAYRWQGDTMGTQYRITLISDKRLTTGAQQKIQQAIEQRLQELNAALSTYRSDSQISRFNQLSANQCLPVSAALFDVSRLAVDVHRLSGGAFNPLLSPLINRWGFGSERRAYSGFAPPSDKEIRALLARSDMADLILDSERRQLCKHSDISLDLSAVAKGYAVDQLALVLAEQGWRNYLVDIGGEIKVAGVNGEGRRWRLGIEQPQLSAGAIAQRLELSDRAIATSGDYRNFFYHAGQRYSHTLDSRSGRPVQHGLASVSVISGSAAEADAWATALTALGLEDAKLLAVREQLAVFLLQRDATIAEEAAGQRFSSWYSPQFEAYLDGTDSTH